MTGQRLAELLRAEGIEVLEVFEWTDTTDAGVTLLGNKDVQIAGRRLILDQWVEDDEAMWHLGEFRSVAELLVAIREAGS